MLSISFPVVIPMRALSPRGIPILGKILRVGMLRLPRALVGESPGPLSMTRLMKGQIKLTHYRVDGLPTAIYIRFGRDNYGSSCQLWNSSQRSRLRHDRGSRYRQAPLGTRGKHLLFLLRSLRGKVQSKSAKLFEAACHRPFSWTSDTGRASWGKLYPRALRRDAACCVSHCNQLRLSYVSRGARS
jgi:hypothetical protein